MAVERTTTTHTSTGATPPPATSHETVRDREVIREHHTGGDRGLGTLIVGALLVLVVAFLGVYMVNALAGSDGEVIPEEVNIGITDDNDNAPVDEAPAEQAPAEEAPAEAPANEAPAEEAPADSTGQ